MKDYKIGLIVFLILATIISLIPPYQWGNEYLKTQKEREENSYIIKYLPIKQYNFLFTSNKKYFPIGSYQINEKVYPGEKLNVDTSDAINIFHKVDTDTLSWRKLIHYQVSKHANIGSFEYFNNTMNDVARRQKFYKEVSSVVNLGKWEEFNTKMDIDSIKKSKMYFVEKPNYYFLKRELLIGELILEYLLAGFIAFFIQIIITFTKKKPLNKKFTS